MGDEMKLVPKPAALISLPRGTREGEQPQVTLWLEWAKAVAGCVVCNQPIPSQVTRFAIRVRLAEPVVDSKGRRRVTEKYSAHPGCLTGPMGQELPRAADQCWDCGRPPPGGFRHPWPVFTTTRFAGSWLCKHCVRKTKWARCSACHVFFPHWMVSPLVGEFAVPVEDDDEWGSMVAEQRYLHPQPGEKKPLGCPFCEARFELKTVRSEETSRAEFEAVRRRIAEEGVFGGDDDG